jgi:hypothetical protein
VDSEEIYLIELLQLENKSRTKRLSLSVGPLE